MRAFRLFAIVLPYLGAALILSGCATTPTLTQQYLDEGTGATVTSSITPLVLYRENPALAAYARNYVHLGTIEVNRMGSYRYYLWLGIWNTMATPDADRVQDDFDAITIVASGEPLPLELLGRTPDAIGVSRPVYLKPVASAADAYYEVTADQIRLIAEAQDIRLRTSGPSSREYQPWNDQRDAFRSMQAFLNPALP
jgi:hypothetical protein